MKLYFDAPSPIWHVTRSPSLCHIEVLPLDVFGPFLSNDPTRVRIDYYAAALGAFSMLKAIRNEFWHGDLGIFECVKLFVVHDSGNIYIKNIAIQFILFSKKNQFHTTVAYISLISSKSSLRIKACP